MRNVSSVAASEAGDAGRITTARERKMTVTLDMVLAAPLIVAAEALKFPSDLGPLALFELGGALNGDDDLWELIEANWALECKSPGKLAEVQTVEIETLKLLPEH